MPAQAGDDPSNDKAILAASEAQLREAQEITHIGSWELDFRTKVVTRSAELCRIFGVDEAQYRVGSLFSYEQIHPADRERFRQTMEQVFSRGTPYEFECRIVRPSGEVRILVARGRVVCDESGRPVRLLGTGQDVTERRELETRLALAERMAALGTLAAGVAHEINNPLTYVISNLALVAEQLRSVAGASAPASLRDTIDRIREAQEGAERVRKTVRDLKVFSRVDEECRARVDVRRALDVSVNLLGNQLRQRARLETDYRDVPQVEGDEARLAQVFMHVLANAAQAMPEPRLDTSEIRVVTETDASGRAVVEVRDTGPGMPQEVASRVFDPFFTTRAMGEGTGIGLSICHGIVTALGGEISLKSDPGHGTTVRIVLPAARAGAAPGPASPRETGARSRAGARILVVDDEPMVGAVIARVLKDHDVTALTDAREARDRIAAGESFDLILCDLMMPELTGMGLHAEVARRKPEQADRMVFMSGGAFTPAARAFHDRMADRWIDKPFDFTGLRALVDRFVGRAGRGDAPG